MVKRVALALVAAVALGGLGCSQESAQAPAETGWTVKGKIVSVDAAGKRVAIDHQDIPGLMGAMTMTFPVEDATLLEGIGEGDAVEFRLEQKARGLTVTKLRKIDPALLEPSGAPKTYQGRGTIVLVNRAAATGYLKHEAIPGVMPAGELMLEARPASLLEGIEDGTPVEFTLTQTDDGLIITELRKRK